MKCLRPALKKVSLLDRNTGIIKFPVLYNKIKLKIRFVKISFSNLPFWYNLAIKKSLSLQVIHAA